MTFGWRGRQRRVPTALPRWCSAWILWRSDDHAAADIRLVRPHDALGEPQHDALRVQHIHWDLRGPWIVMTLLSEDGQAVIREQYPRPLHPLVPLVSYGPALRPLHFWVSD